MYALCRHISGLMQLENEEMKYIIQEKRNRIVSQIGEWTGLH